MSHYTVAAGLNGLYVPNVIEYAETAKDAGDLFIEMVDSQTDGLCLDYCGDCDDCTAIDHARSIVADGDHVRGAVVTYRDGYDAVVVSPCDCATPEYHQDMED